jgi:hypothetical protein
MTSPERGSRGPELLSALLAVLAELERVDRPPTKADTGKIRKALQKLDALVETAGAMRGGELPAESFTRLTTARKSLNQAFVAPKYLRAAESTLRLVLASWELQWGAAGQGEPNASEDTKQNAGDSAHAKEDE